jgi:starvation-inducible DNA-binding protein
MTPLPNFQMKTSDLSSEPSYNPAATSDLGSKAGEEISHELRSFLADVFVLYLKSKNFHWHMSGPHFREYHLLLDEQAEELFGMTDAIAERGRKLGGATLRSISDIARHQRLQDNDAPDISAPVRLAELRNDNQELIRSLHHTHALCDKYRDMATASLIEN